jgi:hypothetical protein
MGDTPTERIETLMRALAATEGKPQEREAVLIAMAPPSPPVTDHLWKWLVRGLIAILVVDLGGIIGAIGLGKPSAALLTVFTTTFAGLIGIFVPKP